MDLFRDVLDQRIEDRNGRPMGRVDGIIIEIEAGQQPQVTFLEQGIVTRAQRINRRFGPLVSRLTKRWHITRQVDRYRLAWARIVAGGTVVIADVEAETTPALAWELWLRKNVIGRIPGA